LVSDPYSIGSMWLNYFSQLLNVHGVNNNIIIIIIMILGTQKYTQQNH